MTIQNDPEFHERVLDSFKHQRVMQLIGARLTHLEPGIAEIEIDARDDLTQQDGFIHAGIVTTILEARAAMPRTRPCRRVRAF